MGSALTISSLTVFQSGCAPSLDKETDVFSADQQNFFDSIADIIIPETDSPGAKEAKVGAFIILILEDCYTSEDRNKVIKSLTEIEQLGVKEFKKAFSSLTLNQQTQLITELDRETYTLANEERSDIHNGYRIIKELTLLGFFTSEVGATQALIYNMTPGRFDGCFDLEPGQKAWA
jgi:hypothetical protein